jgi:hypothetical protein
VRIQQACFVFAQHAASEGQGGSDQAPSLLAEQRKGWSLMIFCARATRGRGLPSLNARTMEWIK